MQIYFSGSIAGGRKYADIYQKIVDYLKQQGHDVLTEFVASPNVLEHDKSFIPQEVFERDMKWLSECDVVIAEVSNPSLGVGYEVCQALQLNKAVLCLYQTDVFVSRIITGNTNPQLSLGEYRDDNEIYKYIDGFLQNIM